MFPYQDKMQELDIFYITNSKGKKSGMDKYTIGKNGRSS
jgi:hypothetical protein